LYIRSIFCFFANLDRTWTLRDDYKFFEVAPVIQLIQKKNTYNSSGQ
jgi:hypothetical protein